MKNHHQRPWSDATVIADFGWTPAYPRLTKKWTHPNSLEKKDSILSNFRLVTLWTFAHGYTGPTLAFTTGLWFEGRVVLAEHTKDMGKVLSWNEGSKPCLAVALVFEPFLPKFGKCEKTGSCEKRCGSDDLKAITVGASLLPASWKKSTNQIGLSLRYDRGRVRAVNENHHLSTVQNPTSHYAAWFIRILAMLCYNPLNQKDLDHCLARQKLPALKAVLFGWIGLWSDSWLLAVALEGRLQMALMFPQSFPKF